MKVITPSDCFSHEYWTPVVGRVFHFEPRKPYLVSNKQFENLTAKKLDAFLEKVSHAEPAFRDFNYGGAKPGSSVLFYNGCGGMGDSIMAWPVARQLALAGYDVHILTEPHLEFAWQGFPWVSTIQLLPCYWKTLSFFDHHAIFESISNSYFHGGQEHPTDHALRKLGFDPGAIPREQKVVRPEFTDLEKRFASWLYPGSRLAFFQLRASQEARSLPAATTRAVFSRLALEFPQFHWIGITAAMDDYSREADPRLPNTEVRKFHRLRNLWALMERAELIVAPDSMAVHLAGSLGIPCVGMWGLYDPAVRIGNYLNHVPVYRREACPHSPCNWNFPTYPTFCPPSEKARTHCAVMEAVTPDDVVAAARRAMDGASSGKLSD